MLPGCLEAIQPLAAEIVVVDTGSTDATPRIAGAAGAQVYHHAWQGSFSAARNAALAACGADWIFVLDADERIAPEDLDTLRALCTGESAYRFVTRNYTRNEERAERVAAVPGDPMARGYPAWFPSRKVRLFPNRPDIRFEGPVHELVEPSVRALGMSIQDAPVPVHHYPEEKGEAARKAKAELYLQLALEKVKATRGSAQAYLELGHQYVEAGSHPQAAAAYREALKRDQTIAEGWRNLAGVLHHMGRHDDAYKAAILATRIDAASPDAWRNLGVICVARGDGEAALQSFQRAENLDPDWPDAQRYMDAARQLGPP